MRSGQNVGHYVLQHRIGAGGMGTVWAAVDERSQAAVALKVLNVEPDLEASAKIRLRREAHASRSVLHPAIVPVLEVLDCGGTPVLVMELLSGETLRDLLQQSPQLSIERISALMLPIVQALEYVHSAGIVHRDLKPENVFIQNVDENGAERVRLLDFGVARFHAPPPGADGASLTDLDTVIGTAAYMAPEQALHPTEIDQRVDIWALGVILYEALSGCRPIEGTSNRDTLRQLLVGAITPIEVLIPELPADIAELVGAMLSRNPERRPATASEVYARLRNYAPTADLL